LIFRIAAQASILASDSVRGRAPIALLQIVAQELATCRRHAGRAPRGPVDRGRAPNLAKNPLNSMRRDGDNAIVDR
jgi:hypothetical protein